MQLEFCIKSEGGLNLEVPKTVQFKVFAFPPVGVVRGPTGGSDTECSCKPVAGGNRVTVTGS